MVQQAGSVLPRRAEAVYVLGSGASMLDLTSEELAFLSTQLTVGMNKYMLFWRVLGLLPSHAFLADIHYPAIRIYEEAVREAASADRPIHFLLDRTYSQRYGRGVSTWVRTMPSRLATYARHRYWYDPAALPPAVTYFRRCHRWDAPERWGRSLHEEMFFWRGSLSCLINLLTVLRLGRKIKLLGVDLNRPGSFFDEELSRRPELFDEYQRRERTGLVQQHSTAAEHKGMPGIQARWGFIDANVQRLGFELVCCNPNSLLVEEGLCPYAPVIEP